MTTTDPNAKAPTPAKQPDLAAIEAEWLRQCGSCDAGLGAPCTCSDGDPRNAIANLVDEVRRLRTVAAENATQHAKIAALEAKLVVVEKQRDNAQTAINTEVDELLKRLNDGLAERGFGSFDVDADPVQAVFDALAELAGRAADWQDLADKTREERDEARRRIESQSDFIGRTGVQLRDLRRERDTAVSYAEFAQQELAEARGRLDALVAELVWLTAQMEADAAAHAADHANGLRSTGWAEAHRIDAYRLREAIAKTAPQTVPAAEERAICASCDHEARFHDRGGCWFFTPGKPPCTCPALSGGEPRSDDKPAADGGVTEERAQDVDESILMLTTDIDELTAKLEQEIESHGRTLAQIQGLAAERDAAKDEIDRLRGKLNMARGGEQAWEHIAGEVDDELAVVRAERDAAVKARDSLHAFRVEVATELGWSDGEPDEVLLKELRALVKARDESANTIANLNAAAAEHTREIGRLRDANQGHYDTAVGKGLELNALRGGVAEIARDIDNLNGAVRWNVIVRDLRALLASPTSSTPA